MRYRDEDHHIIDSKYCSACGAKISSRADACPKCGARQYSTAFTIAGNAAGRNRIVAAILAFVLGGFGIHKFYLGRTSSGILYLLFFWTLIPAIIAFVDFVVLLTMSDQAFDQTYGTPA